MQTERINLPPSVRIAVLLKHGFRCVYCGATREDTKIEVDHVIPVCKGGTNDEGNLVAACRECNAGKSGKLLLDILDSDIGVYVNPKGRPVASVPQIAVEDPMRESPAGAWIPFFKAKWESVDLAPPSVEVGIREPDDDPFMFHPTFTCMGRRNSDIAPFPCDVRVLILPWRGVGEFSEQEQENTIAATISGYEVPTIIILGTPTLFFAVLVNERYKGRPRGRMIDQFLEPFSQWENSDWYPDEDFDFQDLREPFFFVPRELSHRKFDHTSDLLTGVYCSCTGEAL